jgi:hypothetical protein
MKDDYKKKDNRRLGTNFGLTKADLCATMKNVEYIFGHIKGNRSSADSLWCGQKLQIPAKKNPDQKMIFSDRDF